MDKQPSKFKKFLLKLIVFTCFVPAQIYIFFIRHASFTNKINIAVIIVAVIIIYFWLRNKNMIMKAKREKEIQDDNRSVRNVVYFMGQWGMTFIIIYLTLYKINFSFDRITNTMEIMGGVLFIGALFRIRLVQLYKV
jgi:FlaA1/EpsC-like NDP-sugar epimerase